MFLPIVVFVILLAIFLYWKFGTRISLPGLGGVGARMEGFLGSLSPTSTDGKKRLEFLFLLVLVLLGAWIVTPFVYTWFGVNKGLALLIFLIIIGYIVKGPSGTFVPKVAILALVLAGIYVSLPAENTLKEWFSKKEGPAETQPLPTAKQKKISITRDVTMTWMEIQTPNGYRLSSAKCPANAMMRVIGPNIHKGDIDCDNQITLEEDMVLGARLWFRAKEGSASVTSRYVPS